MNINKHMIITTIITITITITIMITIMIIVIIIMIIITIMIIMIIILIIMIMIMIMIIIRGPGERPAEPGSASRLSTEGTFEFTSVLHRVRRGEREAKARRPQLLLPLGAQDTWRRARCLEAA